MIVHTTYGPTNTSTGEILDLSPLARKPKGKPTKRLNLPCRYRTYKDRQLIETGVLLTVLAVITASLSLAL